MKSRVRHVSALILAGVLSLAFSFWGAFGLLWSGFPKQPLPGYLWAVFLSVLLAFPMFVVASGVSKLGCIGLWLLAPVYWCGILQGPGYAESPFAAIRVALKVLVSPGTLGLLAVAALVQYGSGFYELDLDRRMASPRMPE